MKRSLLAVAAAALVLASCQTATTYHPSAEPGGAGYSDEQLAGNRYRVTFTGNSATPRETVEDYLLLRSAEVTLKAGYRYFLFDTRDTKTKTTYHSDFVGWPGWQGRGWYSHNWAFGPDEMADTIPVTRYQAYAEIVLLSDDQAKSEPRAIKAQEVLDHIGPMAKPKP
jgi:opacity protein-like surface antigen